MRRPFKRKHKLTPAMRSVPGGPSTEAGKDELRDPTLSDPPTGYSDDFWRGLGVPSPEDGGPKSEAH